MKESLQVTSVKVYESQLDWVRKNSINLSFLVRQTIEHEMQARMQTKKAEVVPQPKQSAQPLKWNFPPAIKKEV